MKQLYIFLAHHQKLIKKLFLLTYIILITLYVVGIWQYDSLNEIRGLFRTIGKWSGQISIILLLLTLIPGMLKRMNLLDKIESIVYLFRRQLGVLAFFMAVTHVGYMSWIRKIASGENPLDSVFKYQQTGFAAFAIFLLLWVTSNDISMRFLGKWWRYLQRLSYLSVIALILHVFAAGSKIWMVLLAFLIGEALSWVIFIIRNKNASKVKNKRIR
jgi:sulfoxide reductase heme-binding subunit YedZ